MSRRRFFHFREWYQSYLETIERETNSVVFCVVYAGDDDDTPVALLPLKQGLHTVAGVRVRTLELPRHDALHLRDILVTDSAREKLSLAELTQLLKGARELRWDVLALWHCVEDSCVVAAHKLQAPSRTSCTRRFGCDHVRLGPWEQLSQTLSKNFIRHLRKCNNRAKSVEGLKFEMINTLPELEAALAAFLDVEASGWKALKGTAIKQDERLVSFYKKVVEHFGPFGGCEIHLLRANDKPIGGLLLLVTDDTVYVPKVAYDEDFARIGPVHLLFENFFTQCEKRPNLRELNFTSDSSWHDVWKPARSNVYNIYAFNTTLTGVAVGAAMGLAERWRRRSERRTKADLKEPSPAEVAERLGATLPGMPMARPA